jgi:hypothetical protein
MLRYILIFTGMFGSFFMIYYRQKVGDMFGEADWMRKVGGIYNVIVFIAIFVFFWSIAELTGTTSLLFRPFLMLFPGSSYQLQDPGMDL